MCLVVEPIDDYSIDYSIRNYYVRLSFSRDSQNAKLSEISVVEVRRQLQKALLTKEEGGDDEDGYLSMLLRNIVKNLEITLNGVRVFPLSKTQIHLRYEDHLPNTPFFAFGVIIDSLTFSVSGRSPTPP